MQKFWKNRHNFTIVVIVGETQVCERRAESGERKLESGKYRFYRVIFGEAVPISAELEID
jgi:hypothetical protein